MVLFAERVFRLRQDAHQIVLVKPAQGRDDRQTAHKFRNNAELQQIMRLHELEDLSDVVVALALDRRVEAHGGGISALLDDLVKPVERAAADEEDVGRVDLNELLLGYQPPAHRTRKKNGNDRRLILVLTPTLANQYYSELIQTLEDYAGSQEFRVLVCNTFRKRELEKYYLEQFSDNRISGIVYTFLPSFPDEAVRLSARIPLVLIGEKREELPICSIELSNQRAGAMLADHLYSLGHRHAAFISTPMDQTTLARKQRLEGLRQRFHERGRQDGVETSVEALVAPDSREEDGVGGSVPFEYATGARLARELLAREHRATALVGANDMIAIGVISVLREKGLRVPEDYSVCGFDNIFTSSIITPPLTSIDHRLWARCRSAVDQIVKQNDQGHGADKSAVMADKIEYAPQLMIRKSTGPARTSD